MKYTNLFEHFLGFLQVGRRVDTYRGICHHSRHYRIAILQPTQLLQIFRTFKPADLQCRDLPKH